MIRSDNIIKFENNYIVNSNYNNYNESFNLVLKENEIYINENKENDHLAESINFLNNAKESIINNVGLKNNLNKKNEGVIMKPYDCHNKYTNNDYFIINNDKKMNNFSLNSAKERQILKFDKDKYFSEKEIKLNIDDNKGIRLKKYLSNNLGINYLDINQNDDYLDNSRIGINKDNLFYLERMKDKIKKKNMIDNLTENSYIKNYFFKFFCTFYCENILYRRFSKNKSYMFLKKFKEFINKKYDILYYLKKINLLKIIKNNIFTFTQRGAINLIGKINSTSFNKLKNSIAKKSQINNMAEYLNKKLIFNLKNLIDKNENLNFIDQNILKCFDY